MQESLRWQWSRQHAVIAAVVQQYASTDHVQGPVTMVHHVVPSQ
jgi:hypothetical protein